MLKLRGPTPIFLQAVAEPCVACTRSHVCMGHPRHSNHVQTAACRVCTKVTCCLAHVLPVAPFGRHSSVLLPPALLISPSAAGGMLLQLSALPWRAPRPTDLALLPPRPKRPARSVASPACVAGHFPFSRPCYASPAPLADPLLLLWPSQLAAWLHSLPGPPLAYAACAAKTISKVSPPCVLLLVARVAQPRSRLREGDP